MNNNSNTPCSAWRAFSGMVAPLGMPGSAALPIKYHPGHPNFKSSHSAEWKNEQIFFNVCSRIVQVAQVLLTLPYSFSQMGMLSGILLQIFYGFLGSWTAYLISVLYVEYRSRKEKENVSFKNHVIQVIRLFNFLFFHFSYFCVILGWYWIGIRSHHHHLHLIHKARTQVKKYLRSLFQNLFSYCVGIWIAVVWSAWWVTGSILESCRTCLQLYFPLIRICHTTDSLCKVTFFLHSFYFLSRCKINNWVLLIFNYL